MSVQRPPDLDLTPTSITDARSRVPHLIRSATTWRPTSVAGVWTLTGRWVDSTPEPLFRAARWAYTGLTIGPYVVGLVTLWLLARPGRLVAAVLLFCLARVIAWGMS
jgi:hypothetical protein